MNRTDLDFKALCDRAEFRARLEAFAKNREEIPLFPWTGRLPAPECVRLQNDLALLLAEPEETGEPLDWREVEEILVEYAEVAGWEGSLVEGFETEPPVYTMDVRPKEIRVVEKASPAVRKAVKDLFTGFLVQTPLHPERLEMGQIKKMADRSIWQIDLPDGYRLRYYVDDRERVVYIVYLGAHPDGASDGRERSVRAAIHRRDRGET